MALHAGRHSALALLLVACCTIPIHGSQKTESLTPAEAAARVARGEAVLIDVREPSEWKDTGVVAQARLLPLSDLKGDRTSWGSFLAENRGKELILYCRTGNRSGQAAKVLAAEGYDVANAGGLRDWLAAEQPTRPADQPPRDPALPKQATP